LALPPGVLSRGKPRAPARHSLHRLGLAERFDDEPEAALAEIRRIGFNRDRLFALAELSYLQADRTKSQEHYRAAAVYAVSRLERYLECPFKFFAAHVLNLPEERDEQAWMTPQERGHFVHEVFESFFREWQQRGGGAITTGNIGEAMALCAVTGSGVTGGSSGVAEGWSGILFGIRSTGGDSA